MPFDPLHRYGRGLTAFRPRITQGALIDGISLPRYGAGRYAAMLITARCDLAHVRTDIVNLLPIVPLAEWVQFDARIAILLSRMLTLEEKVTTELNGLPPALKALIGDDWKSGADLFLPDADISREAKQKAFTLIDEHAQLKSLLEEKCDSPSTVAAAVASSELFNRLARNETRKKVTALIENKVSDAHFLPVIRPDEVLKNGPGYVILFRHLLSIPGNLLRSLADGFVSLQEVPADQRDAAAITLRFPSGLVSNLISPHVEHIMQRFSNVFGRIGVPDCSPEYKDWIVGTALPTGAA